MQTGTSIMRTCHVTGKHKRICSQPDDVQKIPRIIIENNSGRREGGEGESRESVSQCETHMRAPPTHTMSCRSISLSASCRKSVGHEGGPLPKIGEVQTLGDPLAAAWRCIGCQPS